MSNKHHPYHPIIYVRGFAATPDEIEETVADPYMGFNLGSTKTRQVWNGKMRKFFFESPLVRLKDEVVRLDDGNGGETIWRYDDVYVDGDDLTAPDPEDPTKPQRPDVALPYQSIVVFRYYDEASDTFGTGETPPIEHFATGLSNLILRMRTLVCRQGKHPIDPTKSLDNGVAPEDFRIYLVAHSMGGLVCRAFLQNPELGSAEARKAVDKVFTYATPHNGIDLRIVRNVPGWATFGSVNNFNRKYMAKYLAVPHDSKASEEDLDVSLVTNFPPERIFNLVGTNPSDYLVMRGISSWAAGEASDGLVRMENATSHGAGRGGRDISSPRAYAHRSHSGHYGIVNSEEGYQSLTRFFFGSLRVDGILDIDQVTLPPDVEQKLAEGSELRASYQFEIVVSVRGHQWQMHRRTVRENSAIHRTYDELFPKKKGVRKPDRARSPHLFSVFLDPKKSLSNKGSVAFAFDLAVLVPDYQVDGVLWLKRHFEGGYIYRELILVEAFPDPDALGGWKIKHGFQSRTPNAAPNPLPTEALKGEQGITFAIPVSQQKKPGITATLRMEARLWS